MAINDSYTKSVDGLAAGSDMIVDGSQAGTGALDITELGATGDCDIYREVDTAGDGTWASSVKIDGMTGEWHSQANQLLVSQSESVRLRINNTSGAALDVYASGYEVSD